MPYIRMLILLIISVVLSLFFASWLGIGQYDILILSGAIAPMSLLKTFHTKVGSFQNPQSIIFTKYHSVFKFVTTLFGLALLFGFYKYFLIYGLMKTLTVVLLSSLIQAPLYALLKAKMGMEILLYPIYLLALILLFTVAI